MKCDECGIREAAIHLTEVVNDKVTKLHLCEQCAREKSKEMQSHFGLTDLISGLMDFGPQQRQEAASPRGKGPTCGSCGMSYSEFQKFGKLGCGKCYEAFEDKFSSLLRSIHGSDKHIGKMPFRGTSVVPEQEKMRQLKEELEALIRSEEFEKAAVMRDRIRELEETVEKHGEDGS
ncbi:MAG: UvrB/UvrC motif-containing protein [Candidatus Omnitrophica bacterium]|nr:UvrB/UvrC motif-containing protein [Candidatus Omnitrophota bacterium]MBU1128421.1 UvrB/UvrC motif-containing protein [Candidatus Omnitrophota bacterium]MBU1784760.1 UvrB/UvrC motif-containing protein [Candidatus Omnitrophota bacterium]MBU1852301.1 UvrB/UvrC motif-containing protein [Candidatus Omnitrophota bacterium]